MKKKTEKKTQKMPDLLIPILLILCVLPFVVHLAVYSCGYSIYDWYYANDVITDLYCYYKSYLIDITAVFALIILVFFMGLYRERTKTITWFYPLFFYGGFVILSTIVSLNGAASVQGNFESFESCFVLLSYVILAFYAYQMMEEEKDYRIVWRGIVVLCVLFFVVGGFQVFRHDLLNYDWAQRLVMSAEQYEIFGGTMEDTFSGNNVYLTLYNPNYAGVALSMLFAVVLVMAVTEQKKRERICYGIGAFLLAVLIWYTYARTSLVTMLLTLAAVGVRFLRKLKKTGQGKKANKTVYALAAGIVLTAGVLLAIDAAHGFRYMSKIAEKNDREPLSRMVTVEDGIYLTYAGEDYHIWMEKEKVFCENETTGTQISAKEGQELPLPMEKDACAVGFFGEEPELLLYLADTALTFVQQDDQYYYRNGAGKDNMMADVEKVDFHGLEYIASARGYIWSRTLPLLRYYIFTGSGPDTFAEVFPQEDFAGKIVYADNPDRVIEKAHNDYLTKWVQTGLCSVICIAVFLLIFLKQGRNCYRNDSLRTVQMRLGYGCYLACISYMIASFFNDSTVQTAPFFWVFAGIALSNAAQEHRS